MGSLLLCSRVSAKYRELKGSGTDDGAPDPRVPPSNVGCPIPLVIKASTSGQEPPHLEGTVLTWHLL